MNLLNEGKDKLGFWVQQRWGIPRTAMCRLAVPRLPPGAIPENEVLDLVQREVGTFNCFTWKIVADMWLRE